MARTGITFEEVASAAEGLCAENARPTARAVRERLGSGSMTNIVEHLNTWKSQRRPAVEVVELSAELRRVIVAEIERNVSSSRAETLEELAESRAEVQALVQDLQRETQEREEVAKRAAELEAEAATHAGTIEELRSVVAAGVERERFSLERAETLTRDLARAQLLLEQLPGLRDELASVRSQLDAERERAHVAETRLAAVDTGLHERQAEVSTLRKELEAERQRSRQGEQQLGTAEKAAAEAEASRREAIAHADAARVLEPRLATAEQRLAAAEQRAADAELQVRKLTEQLLANKNV